MGCVGLIICPRRCRWVMYYWAFSPYGLFIFPRRCHWVMYYWAFSPCGLFGVDCLPKALPLGYELLGFQSVWVDYVSKALSLGYVLLGF